MLKINGKEIKGFQYADGVHWYWGDKEVAVINELRREIEWCDRTFNFPIEVVNAIRDKIPTPDGQWIIEARRTSLSATQGNISIFVNNKDMDMHFEDKMERDENGNYVSTTPDSELGKFVYACLWHPYDEIYHYSDRFKSMFKPNWKDKGQKSNYKLLAQKYIRYGITWLNGEFDTYKGKTTVIEPEEDLTEKQLDELCNVIKEDSRVKMARVDSKYTIAIVFTC